MEKSPPPPPSTRLPLFALNLPLSPVSVYFAICYGRIFTVVGSARTSWDQISNTSHLSALCSRASRDNRKRTGAQTREGRGGVLCEYMWVHNILNVQTHTDIPMGAGVYTPRPQWLYSTTHPPLIYSQVTNLQNNNEHSTQLVVHCLSHLFSNACLLD